VQSCSKVGQATKMAINGTRISRRVPMSTNKYSEYVIEVKFSFEQATKAQKGSDIALFSLISALDGGGWSTPRPGRFIPGTHYIGGRVRKMSPTTGIRSPDRPAVSEWLNVTFIASPLQQWLHERA
jgi:hypothetical protein